MSTAYKHEALFTVRQNIILNLNNLPLFCFSNVAYPNIRYLKTSLYSDVYTATSTVLLRRRNTNNVNYILHSLHYDLVEMNRLHRCIIHFLNNSGSDLFSICSKICYI